MVGSGGGSCRRTIPSTWRSTLRSWSRWWPGSGEQNIWRGTSALHLNEATWIIDGSNELIVDFLFALVLFLDSTQPWPFKNPKQIFFFGSNKRMTCKSNSNAKLNPGQHHSSFHLPLHSNAGLSFFLSFFHSEKSKKTFYKNKLTLWKLFDVATEIQLFLAQLHKWRNLVSFIPNYREISQ